MLTRPFKGRNLVGIESQVLRPMSTALRGFFLSFSVEVPWLVEGLRGVGELVRGVGRRFVTLAKKARSAFRGGQGREPRRPMPKEGVVATMRVRGGSCGIGVGRSRLVELMIAD